MPQGPAQAVMPAVAANQGPGFRSGGGSFKVSGWPERARTRSGWGPLSVIFSGVWQSWHPPNSTRYLPRATRSAARAWGALPAPIRARAGAVQITVKRIQLNLFIFVFMRE